MGVPYVLLKAACCRGPIADGATKRGVFSAAFCREKVRP